jgi:UDP-3-O-[3-hydroxymyristoyl] glucosamine N-acyltransferase
VDAGVAAALVHDKPVLLLARLIDLFHPEPEAVGLVHPSAVVDESATVDPTAWIGPGAVLEADVRVAERSWIGPNAVLCRGTRVGRYVRIGPGAVIGYEGFGFAPSPDGPVKVRQIGAVRIEDFVEIGAGACVDRGTLSDTVIGEATKIDNLVQVGHNARLGKRVLIAGQAGLAGSTVIGDDVMLGGQVGVADHRRVGARARVAAQGGVVGDIPADSVVAGTPAVPHRKWLRAMAQLLGAQFERGRGEETEEP